MCAVCTASRGTLATTHAQNAVPAVVRIGKHCQQVRRKHRTVAAELLQAPCEPFLHGECKMAPDNGLDVEHARLAALRGCAQLQLVLSAGPLDDTVASDGRDLKIANIKILVSSAGKPTGGWAGWSGGRGLMTPRDGFLRFSECAKRRQAYVRVRVQHHDFGFGEHGGAVCERRGAAQRNRDRMRRVLEPSACRVLGRRHRHHRRG